MNDMTPVVKPRAPRAKLSIAKPAADAADSPPPEAPAGIVPSSPMPIPLRLLRRAPENVRHTRVDEDVSALAADIAAHGLLQSLIGYATAGTIVDPDPETLAWKLGDGLVHIVGGGRRFQALCQLELDGLVGPEFAVPVLIRDRDEAVELSLAENLQQRTMSPVDEFLAFQALMARGTSSPADLAKRFGFSERVVKQRLRLAELEPEVLDALGEKQITLDAAMAYAGTQDRQLQREVFRAEVKKSGSYRNAHRVDDIRWALKRKGATTEHQLFKFVGADAYERRGGGYEDDLFLDGEEAGKVLSHPRLLREATRDLIDFQMVAKLEEYRQRADLSPTIAGYVVTNDLRIDTYGNGAAVPKGFERIERHDPNPVWKRIRDEGVDCHIVVGISYEGALTLYRKVVLVPKAQKAVIDPPTPQPGVRPEPTAEELAAALRRQGIERWSRRLAVGSFTGTPWEGRALWRNDRNPERRTLDGVTGYLVPMEMFVSDAAIAEQRPAAVVEYDRELAEREVTERAADAARARLEQLRAMEPPAIVVIDGLAWERREDGSFAPMDEAEDGFLPSWASVLVNFDVDDVGEVFATRAAFDERQAAAIAADGVPA